MESLNNTNRKKKVGLLTFHRPLNYGAILQAYALQKSLQEHELDLEIIDYRPQIMEYQYYRLFNPHVSFLRNILKLFNFPAKRRKMRKIQSFAKAYFVLSKKTYSQKTITEIDSLYDFVIVGSDQVWNPQVTGQDFTFFLEGIVEEKKRISYAASMGSRYRDDKLIQKCKPLIGRFSWVSVRESSLQTVLVKHGINCCTDIDPTLLLTESQWQHIIPAERIKNEKYILLYTVAEPNRLINSLCERANEKGLRIIWITDSRKRIQNCTKVRSCGIEDFIRYVRDAEEIFTTSFHCSVFSILFHKTFITETKGKTQYNNRVADLLEMLGLECCDLSSPQRGNHAEQVDWSVIDEKRSLLREQSLINLLNSIGEVNK